MVISKKLFKLQLAGEVILFPLLNYGTPTPIWGSLRWRVLKEVILSFYQYLAWNQKYL
jgi:hypothetical protein